MSNKTWKLAIDCDDAAIGLKDTLVAYLKSENIPVDDLNYAKSHPGANYSEIGYDLAKKIQDKTYERGILICGTGLGMAMVANKVEGVYAGPCHDVYSAERLCKSNDAQVLTLGARVIGEELAKKIVEAFLSSEFAGGNSLPKVVRMRELEHQSFHKE